MAAPTSARPGSSILASGTAAPFNVATLHPVGGPSAECYRSLGRVVLLAGCFGDSLRHGRGGSPIRLLVGHDDGNELASTTDGGLVFIQTPTAIIAGLSVHGSGPRAVHFLRRRVDLRQFSVGFTPTKYRPGRDDRGPLTLVEAAILLELSVVGSGNFPGCTLRLK